MGENSNIEWTTHTFNPWLGCAKVASGCTNCYAESYAKRYGKAQWGPNGTRVKTSEAYWKQPAKWNREALDDRSSYSLIGQEPIIRPRVFCASLADVFEDWDGPILNAKGERLYSFVDINASAIDGSHGLTMADVRRGLFALIDATPHLDWLLLTKRPENIRRMWPIEKVPGHVSQNEGDGYTRLPRDNVWLLTSVAEQRDEKNIDELLQCRDLVPVLGVSHEPALEAVPPRQGIDWWIIGCESNGKRVGRIGARSESQWRDLMAEEVGRCVAVGAAPFVKQVPVNGRVSHDPTEWVEALRVREFPARSAAGE